MIHDNIELHNVGDVQSVPGVAGLRLQRVPEQVRRHLNEAAQMRMLQPDNIEIRFVAEGTARLTLSSEGESKATVFCGLFDYMQRFMIGPEPQTLELDINPSLAELDQAYWADMSFSPKVYRVLLGGTQRDPVYLHGIEGEGIRPPRADELPSLRYLSYGTSITHGFYSEGPHLNYVAQAARRLGADLINLGVGGAAHCESELADYIAARDDWHIASLGLSVNMQGFPLDEFYERVSYLVNTIAGADTRRPVACITLYPYYRDFGLDVEGGYCGTPEDYRQALRRALEACPHGNAHLVEGPQLLTDISGLTSDLIHPGDNGMIEMGDNLAAKLTALRR